MAAHINEVMYNPSGDDNNNEFVEIFGTDNLSGFTIGDSNANDSFVLLQHADGNFSLVVEDGFNFTGLNCSIYSTGATIGDNLNNNNDGVFLYEQELMVDTFSYDGSLANGNGKSLSFIENEWKESLAIGGTPCKENTLENSHINNTNQTANGTMNSTINDSINQSINISLNVTLNETFNNTANTTINNTQNITINITINTTQNNTMHSCNISIWIETEKNIYENKETVAFYNKLSNKSIDFEIEYWIEDAFGNVIKKKTVTQNTDKKSYTPDIEEHDLGLVIKSRLNATSCSNVQQNDAEKAIIVRKPDYQPIVCNATPHVTCPICPTGERQQRYITSFYTRAKKAGMINIYANIQANGNVDVVLYTGNESRKFEKLFNGSETLDFSVNSKAGKNYYFLEVQKDNQTLDFKQLIVSFPENNASALIERAPMGISENRQNNQSHLITGSVIYSSSNAKLRNYLKYGLIVIGIAGVIVYAKHKHQRKDRKWMGKKQYHLRGSWQSKRTRGKNPARVYRKFEEKQGHHCPA